MTVLALFVKVSIVLVVAACADRIAQRRASASARHMIWALVLAGVLVLPALGVLLPDWTALRVSVAPTPSAMSPAVTPLAGLDGFVDATSALSPAPTGMPLGRSETIAPVRWPAVMVALYVAGIILLLARVAGQHWSLRRLARCATTMRDPNWTLLLDECEDIMQVRRPVRLLRSFERTMPMAFGTRDAAILIPAVADTWTYERRRAVLLHELAHVVRHDCLTQTLSAIACACYWIHPGVWWAARRLRIERELACDDLVVSVGQNARDYADHLLELAYTLGAGSAPALAVTMARSTQLEGRLMAVMDAARIRTRLTLRKRLAAVALMAALLLPLAAATTVLVSSAGPDESAQAPQSSGQSTGSAADQPGLGPGTWEVRPSKEPGRVHVRVSEGNSSIGRTVDVALIEALAPGQLGREGPVAFSIRRDAGTFAFEGVMRRGVGAGTFSFTPDPAFASELVKRGFARPTALQQRRLAGADIGFAYLDELTRQGYRTPDLAALVRAGEHDVNLMYLREMGQLGYRLGQLDQLIRMRDHDVTAQFVRGLAAQKLERLSPDDLVRARDHDVSPEYVGGLAALGYASTDLEVLIRLRSHDVSHEYVRSLAAYGFAGLPLETLVRLRSHDVSGDYLNGMSSLGYRRLDAETLIRLRSHDVQPQYVRALQALGYKSLSVEDLVRLRSHDVDADEVRRANARAGRQLPVDRLTALASNDWRETAR